MFKFRTFDKDSSQVYWHIDQAPGKSSTENKHPFKSPTGWANQLSKTESEHEKQTTKSKQSIIQIHLWSFSCSECQSLCARLFPPRLKIHPMCLWKLPGKQDAVSTSGLACDLCPFKSLLHPSLLFDLLVSLLPCLAVCKRAYVKHCQTHVSGARVHARAAQAQTQVYDSAVVLSTMPKHQAHMRMPHENDFCLKLYNFFSLPLFT